MDDLKKAKLQVVGVSYDTTEQLNKAAKKYKIKFPLLSDPFGLGWNLFGTLHYRMDLSIVSAKTVWYLAVAAIVVGHVLAVYLAHVMAIRVYRSLRAAMLSQLPMLVLMVLYTMTSLWILSQPIVQT